MVVAAPSGQRSVRVTPEPLLQRSNGQAESAFDGHRDTAPSASQAALPAPTNSEAWPALRAPLRNRAVLFELSGAAPGAVFSIHRSGITIGRAETSHIAITDSNLLGAFGADHSE